MERFVTIEGNKMNNFCYWLESKFSMECELEFLGHRQI
jgi:hypothetical protein